MDDLTVQLTRIIRQLDTRGKSDIGLTILAHGSIRNQLDADSIERLEEAVYVVRRKLARKEV